MRKMLAFLLVLALLMPAFCFAEDAPEGNEGTILFIEEELNTEDDSEITEGTEPFIPEYYMGEHIIGRDDRVTVKDPKAFPYSAIAFIKAKMECGCNCNGTGFMVDKQKMLTAAHCLICQKHNQWAKSIVFYFGYKKGSRTLYKYDGKWKAHCGTDFPNGYTDANDWAFIRLYKDVGDTTGSFGIRCLNDTNLTKESFYVAGYRDGILKYDFGRLRVKDQGRMWVDMDVLPGNSGSPIYDRNGYAVGIWTTFWDNGSNSGIRLTRAILDYVKSH